MPSAWRGRSAWPAAWPGTWRAAPTLLAGLPFEPIFFFAGGQLRRVEWVAATAAAPDLGAAAFAEHRGLGPRAASDRSWARTTRAAPMRPGSQGDPDIYAQRTSDARHASVRLVYKARQLKDAAALSV